MDIAILIEKLTFADNIYDLVGIAYEYIIEVGEVDACRKFKEKSEEVRNVEDDLIGPIFQYSEGIITFETVRENFVKMIKSNLLDYDIICVLLVQIFDRFYEYKTNETYEFKIKHAVGPLNNVTYSEKVLIYTKPVETFIKEINNKAKFRRIIPYDASSINEVLKLQKYILLKASNFDNYPRVSKYIDNGFFKECLDNENKIKIGVVPFCGFEAVKVKTIGETFFIDGPKEELISNIVDRYIKIIKK